MVQNHSVRPFMLGRTGRRSAETHFPQQKLSKTPSQELRGALQEVYRIIEQGNRQARALAFDLVHGFINTVTYDEEILDARGGRRARGDAKPSSLRAAPVVRQKILARGGLASFGAEPLRGGAHRPSRYAHPAPEPLCIQNRPIIHHRISETVYFSAKPSRIGIHPGGAASAICFLLGCGREPRWTRCPEFAVDKASIPVKHLKQVTGAVPDES